MIDLITSTISLVWPLIVMVLGLIGVIFWGNKKKEQGIAEEKERSRRVVQKVQDSMNKETQKKTTKQETDKRLRDGTF